MSTLELMLNRTLTTLVSFGMGRGATVDMIIAISDPFEGGLVSAFTDGARRRELDATKVTEVRVADGTPEAAAADRAFELAKSSIDFTRYSVLLGVFEGTTDKIHVRSSTPLN